MALPLVHSINAPDVGYIQAYKLPPPCLRLPPPCPRPSQFSLSEFTASGDSALPRLTEVTLDLSTGQATVRRVAELPGDFPQVPASLLGRPCRYVYTAAMKDAGDGIPLFYGIAKIDLQAKDPAKAVAGLVEHGAGRLAGEAAFVPGGRDGAEDDGYLVTYVFDEASGTSEFVAYDAKTMSSKVRGRGLVGEGEGEGALDPFRQHQADGWNGGHVVVVLGCFCLGGGNVVETWRLSLALCLLKRISSSHSPCLPAAGGAGEAPAASAPRLSLPLGLGGAAGGAKKG